MFYFGGDNNDFNPRSPYGERRLSRETLKPQDLISIHAPLTGSDYGLRHKAAILENFNPRSPYGERQS